MAEPNVPAFTIGGRPTTLPLRLPLITFIVINRNYSKFVGAAIDSIKAQDYPRFNAIVVDNASEDDSREIVRQHLDNDPRFHCLDSRKNLGALGGALLGLEHAAGDFVCVVDSDDCLFPNFASMHIQAHFAARRNVAFTSSDVLEIDGQNTVLCSGRSLHDKNTSTKRLGVRSSSAIPRLATVSDAEFGVLSDAIVNFSPTDGGWLWSPGTANVYRRFVLEEVKPKNLPVNSLVRMAVDAHFARLAHLYGGSALIRRPLSGYRLHGNNHSADMVSLDGAVNNLGPASKDNVFRRIEAARVLLSDSKKFAWRFGSRERYWTSLDMLLGRSTGPRAGYWRTTEVVKMLGEYSASLSEEFGHARLAKELSIRVGSRELWSILKSAQFSYLSRVGFMAQRFSRKVFRRRRPRAQGKH